MTEKEKKSKRGWERKEKEKDNCKVKEKKKERQRIPERWISIFFKDRLLFNWTYCWRRRTYQQPSLLPLPECHGRRMASINSQQHVFCPDVQREHLWAGFMTQLEVNDLLLVWPCKQSVAYLLKWAMKVVCRLSSNSPGFISSYFQTVLRDPAKLKVCSV